MNSNSSEQRVEHIPVLDGVRAYSILLIAWFHIWQQSWLGPYFSIGDQVISFDWLVRSAFQFVDVLILLSGFCLYLPYAHRASSTAPFDWKGFYIRRVARILPSYWLNIVIVLFCFALPLNQYGDDLSRLFLDVASHLSFTQVFWFESSMDTKLNGVLWTLAVEVQFYLIFPWVAALFRRFGLATYLVMVAAAFAFRYGVVAAREDLGMWFNQLPNFLDVYANGMGGAVLYVRLKTKLAQSEASRIAVPIATSVVLLCMFLMYLMLSELSASEDTHVIQSWQSNHRFEWSAVVVVFMIAAAFSGSGVQRLLINPFTAFVSVISYNFFIWHQYWAVQLKQWHWPPSLSTEPHMDGDHHWQVIYTVWAFGGAFVLATLATYGFERPLARVWKRHASG